ncbi:MAG: rRNA maturation RNase YbeY [Mangrovibacterium sp.]|nr:rRNA maturation RNase YbeY [Mangrovibacterium sp.]
MSINFYIEDVYGLHLAKVNLRSWIKSAIKEENRKTGDLNFIFCSDEYLLRMNQQYLEHDFYTDIITFDYVAGLVISGDIFISVDRVKENAGVYRVRFEDELNRIMIHGVLHLLGYQDKEAEQKKIMTEKEDYYLGKVVE